MKPLSALIAITLTLHITGPASAENDPLVLEPIVSSRDYATARYRLQNGDYVQLTSGCSEWSGGGTAYLLHWDTTLDDWEVVLFPSGPFLETPGHLLIESHSQVGSDGTDEPPWLPEGCQHTIRDSTGTISCTQVISIGLESGSIASAGWDTMAPLTAGAGRYAVVFSAGDHQTPHRHIYGRPAAQAFVWDLQTGDRGTTIGSLAERPHARAGEQEVFLRIAAGSEHQFRAVDGTTGEVRKVSGEEAQVPERTYRLRRPRWRSLTNQRPDSWLTQDGRPIRVESVFGSTRYSEPSGGGCGLETYLTDGLLFTDFGVYRWPDTLR